MKILVASSKDWFEIDEKLKYLHTIEIIKDRDELSLQNLNRFEPDLIFFPHWNWVVPVEIHSKFTCIVFHTAPLPYGRGGSPIQNLIIKGFKEAPVCALKMTSELDAGPIYTQKIISLEGTLTEIFERINNVINIMISELSNKLPEPKAQSGEVVTFERINNFENEITLKTNLNNIYDQIRMLDSPYYPNSFLNIEGYKLEFYDVEFKNNKIVSKCVITTNEPD